MDEDSAAQKAVPAIVRAKAILDEVSSDSRPQGVSELAKALRLPKSTVHGLCRTMAELGILDRVDGGRFVVGPQVLTWAGAFETQNSLVGAFMQVASLAEIQSESINLTVLAGTEVMYIACRQGSDPLGVTFRPGLRLPAPFTATGKAILSTMPESDVRQLFEQSWPRQWTRASVVGIDELLKELDETRRQGYSVDNGQLREAMMCYGAPVFGPNPSGAAIAGVAVGVLSGEGHGSTPGEIIDAVMTLARGLTRRMGGRTP